MGVRPEGPGTKRYEIRRRIGAGGMGIVYEALDRERNTPVALKVLTSSDARWITMFKNEFRSLADTVHPNLVAMYELVADEQNFFFTMELVRGAHFLRYVRRRADRAADTLGQTVSLHTDEAVESTRNTYTTVASPRRGTSDATPRNKPDPGTLDLARLRQCLPQLAEAVAALHEAGMLHRDLKSSNVLVTEAGRLVVLDFGLVTAVSQGAQPSRRSILGTAAYMAPELAAHGVLSEATDWYAVGVMLYEALTGRLPFTGGSADMRLNKQQFDPTPPRELASDIPVDLNDLCMDLLQRDPAKRPDRQQVLRRLGSKAAWQSDLAPATRAPGGCHLVGRHRERSALHDAFASTCHGKAILMFVRGASGMGKSSLVRGFLDDIDDWAVVLRGRCYERESIPFKAVDSVVDSLASYLLQLPRAELESLVPLDALALAQVFPVLRQIDAFTTAPGARVPTSDPHLRRWSAFHALRQLLTGISNRQPLVVAIDDMQWGDADSAGLLAALLAPPNPPSLLLLGCCRPETGYANAFLDAFAVQTREHGVEARTTDVGPLATADARELALLNLGDHADAVVHAARIAEESAGNPFFVEELARHVLTTGEVSEALSLDDTLRTRLDLLPRDARTLLATIAVAGRPLPQPIALDAADRCDPAALSLLKTRSFIRTISAEGQRYVETYHDRVRETVVELMTEADLRERHRELARTLSAGRSSDAEALALHYRGAGERERAAEFAEIAARRGAESLAFDQAARMYRLALEMSADQASIRRLQTELGDALSRAGRSAAAATAYLDAIEAGASESDAIELKRRAAEELLCGGHVAAGLKLVDELLDSIDVRVPSTPKRAIVSLLAGRARLALRGTAFEARDAGDVPASRLRQIDTTFAVAAGLATIDAIRAAALGTRHLLMALDAGEPYRVLQALATEACFISVKGTRGRARVESIMARVDELADRVGTPEARAFVHGTRGIAQFQFGEWRTSFEHTSAAHALFRDECTGHTWEESTAIIFQAHSLAFMGRIRELNDFVDDALRRAAERGDHYLDTSLRVAVRFYAHAANDDPAGAIAELDQTLERWTTGRFDQQVWTALLSYFIIDGYAGEPERGIERHHTHWRALKKSHLQASQVLRTHHITLLARLYLQAGVRDHNADYLKRCARSAQQLDATGAAYAQGFASLLRAGAAGHAGDDDGTLRHLVAAEATFADTDMALNEAACKVRRGQLVGGDEGAALIAEGSAHFHSAGMNNIEALVRAVCPGFSDGR